MSEKNEYKKIKRLYEGYQGGKGEAPKNLKDIPGFKRSKPKDNSSKEEQQKS